MDQKKKKQTLLSFSFFSLLVDYIYIDLFFFPLPCARSMLGCLFRVSLLCIALRFSPAPLSFPYFLCLHIFELNLRSFRHRQKKKNTVIDSLCVFVSYVFICTTAFFFLSGFQPTPLFFYYYYSLVHFFFSSFHILLCFCALGFLYLLYSFVCLLFVFS